MNNVYTYDGDFLSLLNLIDYLIKHNVKPYQIKDSSYSPSLFDTIIPLDFCINNKIIDEMVSIFGKYVFQSLFYVYLSTEKNKEIILYYFILNAFKYPSTILKMRNLKCVREVLRISQYVSHESHKMKGFLRFKELTNAILYAEISPTNNVLYLITNHFKKRLGSEYWIIKDVVRGIYALYNKKKILYVLEEDFQMKEIFFSEEEKKIEYLWKLFYQTTGISSRRNNRCRMNFMPKKYWSFITEVRDEL